MRTFFALAMAALLACSCGVAPVAALDRDEMLKVVGTVHADYHILGTYDEVQEESKEASCKREFTRDIQPVCGSNGKKYTNLSMFEYRQCMIKVQEGTELELAAMEFCKDVEMEDMENVENE
ncbi:hypothetical protein BBJ28_00016052 [Nothophytophthora sp. Chile5]|nr:hypothetical protein BBJ28_00016052 [Nothophytophthora sp. Chile5]